MTQYCETRWKLYNAWCATLAALRQDNSQYFAVNQARWALEGHHRDCPQCREHAQAMLQISREAVMPPMEDDNA